MIKLSIIITAYNAEPYIHELLDRLEPQVTDEVQTIVIDDGSTKPLGINRPWIEFYSNDGNKGIPYSRNRGLDLAKGICIHYIDADDLVPVNYVKYIINLIDSKEFDYIDLSWKSLPGGGAQCNFKLNSDNDSLPNPSSSTRVFKREFIGDTRFNLNKDAAEDEDFTRHLGIKHAKHICATEYMYFYRTYVPNSNSKLYFSGLRNTHKVGFFYNHVDSYDILEKVKEADKFHEPVVLTFRNDIPELEKYATVICPPQRTRVMEAYGEDNKYFEMIPMPYRTQVVIYSSIIGIGGIETFIYNFCKNMEKYYDIIVAYKNISEDQLQRFESFVRCERVPGQSIVCDTLIMNRIADEIPDNISYQQSVQVVHACNGTYDIQPKKDRNTYIAVSETVNASYRDVFENISTINNITFVDNCVEPLLLISTARLDTPEKGQKRMLDFAQIMKNANIPFLWIYFSNREIHGPKEMIRMPQSENILAWVSKADYLVHLSDTEGMSYSILEAMELGTKLIVTPLPMLDEIGFEDGKDGYIVPFDLKDIDIDKFKPKKPRKLHRYNNHNDEIIAKWRKLLGNTIPKHDYNPDDMFRWVEVTQTYYDNYLRKTCSAGQRVRMTKERAEIVKGAGYCKYVY